MDHSRSVVIDGVAMDRLGETEVGLPWEGSRGGESKFRRTRSVRK